MGVLLDVLYKVGYSRFDNSRDDGAFGVCRQYVSDGPLNQFPSATDTIKGMVSKRRKTKAIASAELVFVQPKKNLTRILPTT